ncbi:hypothetical protein [Streptomyces sp. NPDC056244]|uniref:hypothetical protein n=1 Tax=Streptomyces sp. NPDC056244 TaxID=3345762 RepID=UPI0035D9A3E0
MPLYAREFFTELGLPFTDSTVVGNTYYATPSANSPLRLRIDFSGTIVADQYGGLRLTTVHPDRGEVDTVALAFRDHDTFRSRDEVEGKKPGYSNYGTFDLYYRAGEMPWQGAETTGLRNAIKQYSQVWFPGAWNASSSARAPGRTVRHTPAAPITPPSGRSR